MIELEREELASLCRKYRVRQLWAFGSALRDDFDPKRSDLDLVVEFDPPVGMSLADQYFDLLEELQQVFGRRVDLVERSAIKNSRFAAAVEKAQQLLYAA